VSSPIAVLSFLEKTQPAVNMDGPNSVWFWGGIRADLPTYCGMNVTNRGRTEPLARAGPSPVIEGSGMVRDQNPVYM
jgi:hypothetical protein